MTASMTTWLMLAAAIVAEVTATSTLKFTESFSRLLPSLVVVAGYACSFWFLGKLVHRMEVGILYAIWCGVGIALVALIGVLWQGESVSILKMAGLACVVGGIAMLSMAGGGH